MIITTEPLSWYKGNSLLQFLKRMMYVSREIWANFEEFERWWESTMRNFNDECIPLIIKTLELNPDLYKHFEDVVAILEKDGRYYEQDKPGMRPIKPTWDTVVNRLINDVSSLWQGEKPMPFYRELRIALKGNHITKI